MLQTALVRYRPLSDTPRLSTILFFGSPCAIAIAVPCSYNFDFRSSVQTFHARNRNEHTAGSPLISKNFRSTVSLDLITFRNLISNQYSIIKLDLTLNQNLSLLSRNKPFLEILEISARVFVYFIHNYEIDYILQTTSSKYL